MLIVNAVFLFTTFSKNNIFDKPKFKLKLFFYTLIIFYSCFNNLINIIKAVVKRRNIPLNIINNVHMIRLTIENVFITDFINDFNLILKKFIPLNYHQMTYIHPK